LLPIGLSIYTWSKIGRELKALFVLFIVGFTIDCFSVWKLLDSLSLHVLAHLYVLLEFMVVLSIIVVWQQNQKNKRVFKILFPLFIVFWLCAKFTFEPLNGLYSLTASIAGSILILCSGYTLFIVFINTERELLKNPRFWILLSFVVSFTGTLMPIAVQEILFTQSRQSLFIAWYVTWASTIIANILFTVGFLCPQKQT
jgi:hypothetical protein